MTAGLTRAPTQENVSSTLSSGITDIATTVSIADASKLVSPCYLVIDRVDSAGTLKNVSLWEYVKVTSIVANDLTVTRAQGGSTQQSHSSGAVIEAIPTAAMFTDWYAVLNPEHTASGGHTLGNVSVLNLYAEKVFSASATITSSLNLSSASVVGVGLHPTWYIPSLPSLASTGLGRPITMPKAGNWSFVNVTLNANISSASVFFDINKNFTSIFDAIGRPRITGGTFVSTASIKTKNFNAGDVFNVDYEIVDLGGNNVDAVITLSSI
jgi:hypothetical protein